MNRYRDLLMGIMFVLIGLLGLNTLPGASYVSMGMMGGMMMDNERLKSMMKSMMGNQLPLGIAASDLPETESSGAKLLQRYCSQCHDLPGPGLHTADEWPAVLDRMLSRMQMMFNRGMMSMMHDIESPSTTENRILLAYLKKHARQE